MAAELTQNGPKGKLIRDADGVIHSPFPATPPPQASVWDNVVSKIDLNDKTLAVQEHCEGGVGISYGDLKRRSIQLGVGFVQKLGLKAGDMV